jgi:hypothetical protein
VQVVDSNGVSDFEQNQYTGMSDLEFSMSDIWFQDSKQNDEVVDLEPEVEPDAAQFNEYYHFGMPDDIPSMPRTSFKETELDETLAGFQVFKSELDGIPAVRK